MVRTYGFLSTHPPTQCGLATFNSALAAHLGEGGTRGGIVRVVTDSDDARPARGVVHTWTPGQREGWRAATSALDRWVLGELADTVDQVTRNLDDYDATSAARRLASFVDDLSNWYVRLSRRRFWRGTGEDADAAFRTLWTCLRTVTLLMAPYAPFTAEELWQGLVVSVDPEAPDNGVGVQFELGTLAARVDEDV